MTQDRFPTSAGSLVVANCYVAIPVAVGGFFLKDLDVRVERKDVRTQAET